MDEYIIKEKALKMLQMQLLDLESNQDKGDYSEQCENRGARDALDNAIYDIRVIKAADVQPVRYGQWIWDGNKEECICSECGKGNLKYSTVFCPDCGARMDGDSE